MKAIQLYKMAWLHDIIFKKEVCYMHFFVQYLIRVFPNSIIIKKQFQTIIRKLPLQYM